MSVLNTTDNNRCVDEIVSVSIEDVKYDRKGVFDRAPIPRHQETNQDKD